MKGADSKKNKPEEFTETWIKIFRYIRRYSWAFAIAVILSAIGSILTLIGPYILSDMTDVIEKGISGPLDMDEVKRLALILFLIYLISGIIRFAENFMMATVSQRSAQMFRRDITRKMNRIPLRYFDKSSKGDIMSRVTNDVDTLGASMNQCIGTVVTALTTLAGSFVLMALLNIPLTLLSLAIAVTGFSVIKIVAKRTRKYFRSQQKNLGAMNGLVEEQYSGHTIVTIYGGHEAALSRFDSINDELARSAFRSQFLGSISSHLNGLIGNVGYVLICVAGAMLYMDGQIHFGVIVAFMIYVKLFTSSFSQLSSSIVTMQSVAAAAERVFIFLDYDELPPEQWRDIDTDVRGHVEFRNVCFSYDKDKEIIHEFSADIQPGSKIAIVGPTGAGKTTIVNLLMRFYDLDSGDILIDGIPISTMSRQQVRSLFGMVLQDTWMFEGTLRENIVFNNRDVSEEKLDEACEAVGLGHYVSTLPNGYDTLMNDDGQLSVGQKQQVTLARAMVKEPAMIILDEATSSVDPLTEKMIQQAMDKVMKGRTSFVIAHRLSTILDADMVIVMKDGRIEETGTHEELLQKGGLYREIYMSQFEKSD